VGRTSNPFTLTNYLSRQVASGARFALWKSAWRNIIDADDVAAIATCMIEDPAFRDRTLNIASPHPVRVLDLVRIFETVMGTAPNFELVDRGDHYDIDVAEAARIARTVPVDFGPGYVEKVIRIYYGKSGARA
jgi:nucleoside-diphosphate-sugar epimerase